MPDDEDINSTISDDQKDCSGSHKGVRSYRLSRRAYSSRYEYANWVLAAFTVLIFFTYVASDYFFWRQLGVMNGQLAQMKGSSKQTDNVLTETHSLAVAANAQARAVRSEVALLQDQSRPWIKISDVLVRHDVPSIKALTFQRFPKTGKVIGATLQIEIQIKNVGRSVAQNILIVPELFFTPWSGGWSDRVLNAQKHLCKAVRHDRGGFPERSALFPEESDDWYFGAGGPIEPDNVTLIKGFTDAAFVAGVLIACVNYQYGTSPAVFQSRVMYDVFAGNSRFMQVGKDISADQIKLTRNVAGEYAQ